MHIKITVRNIHFSVVSDGARARDGIKRFNLTISIVKRVYNKFLRRSVYKSDKKFYHVGKDNITYYSISLLQKYVRSLTRYGISKSDIEIIDKRDLSVPKLTVTLRDCYHDRDYQKIYIKDILYKGSVCLLDLPTGKGKTYISFRVGESLGYRTGIVVLPKYIKKWESDILSITNASERDIIVIHKYSELVTALECEVLVSYCLINSNSIKRYIKKWDMNEDDLTIPPEDIFSKLGLGLMVCDEVHRSYHQLYLISIRMNPKRLLGLSATLDHLDQAVANTYNSMYPPNTRCGPLVSFPPYIIVIAITYSFSSPNSIQCKGPMGYSHDVFEKSILRDNLLRVRYVEMIVSYVNIGYIDRMRSGDKVLILVQKVLTATVLSNYLKNMFDKLSIKRYVEKDSYDDMLTGDIIVSTNGSAGDAFDIPNLITVIQTVSMSTLQGNIQAPGRLREIPDVDVIYYYTYSRDLDAHKRLDNDRRSVLLKTVKEYRYIEYPDKI